ncbi:MAG: Gfo/Idh/MocA family oxidoreductase [Anaerolineae bacterium]|nr:Gfo/Idh/MocA family oxidoreductase [Anaerolineae bacterium]NUQ03037.1 Gfo/Idh/MocA family oxidoreductase [Anaerolineae bacterium]
MAATSESRKRYAIIGTGSRAGMYFQAICGTYRADSELVGLCDLSQTRMDWYNRQLSEGHGLRPIPTYLAGEFDRMIAETKPDIVVVATIDATHHQYIVRAMELGCDVISEKPMTTDIGRMRAIFDAIARTGRSLRVTFNYRYAPAYTRFRQLVMDGVIGRPLSVDFSWLLDTSHGADYFRRWHREKANSGGLLVHKATHHFDLVNWWIGSYPQQVMAMGDLLFYGKRNAEARGEHYAYARYTGVAEAANDPFALFLTDKEAFRGLYLNAEAETGYLRDRNVFGEPITIEDTMSVSVRYRSGAILSYCLIAYSPWEGLRVAITGTKGRIEMDIAENINHLLGDGRVDEAAASKGSFKSTTMRVHPMFGQSYEVDVPQGDGGHGGADPVMLEQIFSPTPPPDPYRRAASHIDGAASALVGIAANQSMLTGQVVNIDDLLPLPAP